MIVDLGVEGRPVRYAAVEGAGVDEVVGAWAGSPRGCYIVEFELAIWRGEGGLDGGEVDAKDFCTRVGVGHIYAPDLLHVRKMQEVDVKGFGELTPVPQPRSRMRFGLSEYIRGELILR